MTMWGPFHPLPDPAEKGDDQVEGSFSFFVPLPILRKCNRSHIEAGMTKWGPSHRHPPSPVGREECETDPPRLFLLLR